MLSLGEIFILLITAGYLLYLYSTRNHNYWKKRGVPYVKPIPFFGNALNVCLNIESMGYLTYKIYQKIQAPFIGFFVGNQPLLVIKDPEVIKSVLVQDADHFKDHTIICDKKVDLISACILFVLKSPEWKELRRKASPVFSPGKIKGMHSSMAECANNLVIYLDKVVDKDPVNDIRDICERFAADALMLASFGIKANCCNPEEESGCRELFKDNFNWKRSSRSMSVNYLFLSPLITRYFKLKFIDETTGRLLDELFWKATVEREKSGLVRNDMTDVLVNMKKSGNIADDSDERKKLASLAIQIFIAGYETTSSLMALALWELAQHPEIQETATKEIVDVKERHGGITYESLQEMHYLIMCIKETLRKYPTLPFVDRLCNRDYLVKKHNLLIESGTSVWIPLSALQNDEKYFPDPSKYDPLRFSKGNIQNIPDFAYMPFGEGPRMCIGERSGPLGIQCGLAQLLSKYSVSVTEETPNKIKFYTNGFLMSPDSEIKLKFRKL